MFIRVEYNKIRHFVHIGGNVEELTIKWFVKKVVGHFGIQDAHGKKVYLHDQFGFLIGCDEVLQHLISTQNNTLILTITFEDVNEIFDIAGQEVTSQNIRSFLEINSKDIVTHHEEHKNLTEKLRKRMCDIIVDEFLVKRYGVYPSSADKHTVATAAANYFECYKMREEDSLYRGGDLFYNPNRKTGWFYAALKKRQSELSKTEKEASKRKNRFNGNTKGKKYVRKNFQTSDKNSNDNDISEVFNNNNSSSQYNEIDAIEDIAFLKSCKVDDTNMTIIKKKLELTVTERWEMVKQDKTNLLEQFPYFFVEPKLILFDFLHHFPGYDENLFKTNWVNSTNSILNVFKTHAFAKEFATEYSDEVKPFLILLKMFPARFSGRKSAVRLSFDETVEKCIVFRKTGTPIMNAMKSKNTQPYIVACGSDPKHIQQYFIIIEQKPMNVPRHFTFHETFDLWFKSHFVFDFCFDFNLNPMLNFVQEYFYDIKSNYKFSNNMIQFYNDMKKQINQTDRPEISIQSIEGHETLDLQERGF